MRQALARHGPAGAAPPAGLAGLRALAAGWIVEGYSTLFGEVDAQLAQAAVVHYRSAAKRGGVTDDEARRAAADLAAAGVSSGPSGAASLADARAVQIGKGSAERRAFLAVGADSVIVLLSTETGIAG